MLERGEVPERGLVSLSVVEDLDVLEQVEACRGASREAEAAADPADLAFSVDQKVSIAALS